MFQNLIIFAEKRGVKIQTLNGLRGLAALTVVICHLPQITHSAYGYNLKFLLETSRFAYIAVDIFFILSGFLITRNLLKDKELNRFSFKNFYIKRFLRIFPIYYLSILLVGLFITWEHLGWVAAYLSNYYFSFDTAPHPMLHTWSLAVEEHFYIIWPAIVLFCSYRCFVKNWLLISLTILILSMILYCYFFEANTVIYLVGKSTNTRFISLVIGAFIAYKEDYFRSLRNNSIYPFLTAICYTIVFIISYNGALINTFLPWIIPSLIFATLGSTFLFIYALNLEGKNNYANRIFTNKVIVYMGLISYGLYLYHYPIFYKLGFFTDNQISGFYQIVLALTLSIGISALSYRYIEKPLLRYKDRITR